MYFDKKIGGQNAQTESVVPYDGEKVENAGVHWQWVPHFPLAFYPFYFTGSFA